MDALRSMLEGAGLGRFRPSQVLLGGLIAATTMGIAAYQLIRIPGFAFFIAVASFGLSFEFLALKAKSRRRDLLKVWPEVIDSLVSAASSGASVGESLIDLEQSGTKLLKPHFRAFRQNLDYGNSLNDSLRKLQSDLGDVYADRLVQLITIVDSAGGVGFHSALKAQVANVRRDIALQGEIDSKQGWVTGTAKIAVAAPWIILLMLSSRPENVEAYATESGSGVLVLGLFVSIIAYRLILLLGVLPRPPRVFR
jgi:tight adherence protein B